jgi:putative flippase GtrA
VAVAIGHTDVVSTPCLKPFPAASLHQLAQGREAIVTFEEHSIYGGLSGIAAETLVGQYIGTFVRIGINDQFSSLCGNYPFLMESHGLAPEAIENRIRKALDANVQIHSQRTQRKARESLDTSTRGPISATPYQLLRFLVVGGLNTAFGYSLFAVLIYVGTGYPIAIGLATIGGVLFNFQSFGRWVFRGAPWSRFWRFVSVYCVVYLVNLEGVWLLVSFGMNVYVANAIILIPLSLLAFILNRRFVFNLL